MRDLSVEARLFEEIIRRTLRQYQAALVGDDYHKQALERTLEELPRIVQSARKKVEADTADPDAPSPYDLGAVAGIRRGR